MNNKAIHDWTKEDLLVFLAGRSSFSNGIHSIETHEGNDSSIVVSMYTESDLPISLEMNGKQIKAEVVLFSLSEE